MANEDSVNSTVQQAMDQGRNIADKASETVKEGYKAAQQYAQDNLSVDIADFVRCGTLDSHYGRVCDRLCCGANDSADIVAMSSTDISLMRRISRDLTSYIKQEPLMSLALATHRRLRLWWWS